MAMPRIMKINFTKKEYQTLVAMLLTADNVLHGHEVEPADETTHYEALRKKVLRRQKEMGMEADFEHAPKHDNY
jgi:hypothetical protein